MNRVNYYLNRAISKIPYEIRPKYHTFDYETFYKETTSITPLDTLGLTKINYACGNSLLPNWLNVDFNINPSILQKHKKEKNITFYKVNLIAKHPFPDNCFSFGFAEDFLEHLQQADSIIFLSECFRCLKPEGVLRLSFPGLEGVLKKHYKTFDYRNTIQAKMEAYTMWEHLHFYSKEELILVAKHIGYRTINFVEYGISSYKELNNLDTREDQIDLNTYAELVK